MVHLKHEVNNKANTGKDMIIYSLQNIQIYFTIISVFKQIYLI
jgi:hypothetical protein